MVSGLNDCYCVARVGRKDTIEDPREREDNG